jgi:serine/threonine protein kinase/Tfp pilus assembly protein PilF
MSAAGNSQVTVDEAARRRFEQAWRAGRPEPIERFLPAPDQPLYLPTLEELVQIELEFFWKQRARAGADPALSSSAGRVESYLERFPRLNQPAIVRRLLRQEWQVRRAAGDPPTVAEFQARFPQVIGDGHDLPWPSSAVETPGLSGEPEPLPGRLGRYQILGRLGAGGMGVVYRAHDAQLRREVAIKVPSFHGSGVAQEARQRFLRETQAAAAIRHPGVCPIYDAGEDAGRPFVVMALIEGESLAERLRRQGRFEDPCEAATLLLPVADALAALHAAHIVHRDVKPGNILLDRAGVPYLSDFGLARSDSAEPLTWSGQMVGTPAYMAPEQAAPDLGPVGPRADQYSLGIVLYQMLTGRLPFEGPAAALIYQIGSRPVPPPSRQRPDLDAGLERLLLKALARRPEERYGGVADFAAALRGWREQKAAPPGPSATPGPPPAGVARKPAPSPPGDEISRLHLAALYHLEKRTEEAHRKSIATYFQILDKDPTFAPAWAGVAFAYHLLSVWGYVSPINACPKAKSAALRALALDDSLGEAHRVLATILLEYDWDLAGAEQAFRRALELTPEDADAHRLFGKCLTCQGRHAEALVELRRAEGMAPLSPIVSTDLGRYGFILARKYDEAVRQFRKTLEIDPTFWLAHRFLGLAYLFQGKMAEAVSAYETARRFYDQSLTVAGLGYAYAVSGQHSKAQEALDGLTASAKDRYVSPDCQAMIYIGLGDKDRAFSWLEKAVEDRSEWLCKVHIDPALDPLRSDPRFDALLRRVNVRS